MRQSQARFILKTAVSFRFAFGFLFFQLMVVSAWFEAWRRAQRAALKKHFEGFRKDAPPAVQAGQLLRIFCELT
jgi:hypothetical protein